MKTTENELLEAYTKEQIANRNAEIVVCLELPVASAIIANLQLALRHPGNTGGTADIARDVIRRLIGQMRLLGFNVSADLAELGNDPANDVPA